MADESRSGSRRGEAVSMARLLSFLRWLPGAWSRTTLSRKSGVNRNQIRRYEEGKERPLPEQFHKIRSAAGVPERLLGFLRWCLEVIQKALARETGVEAPARDLPGLQEAMGNAAARTAALAQGERSAAQPPAGLARASDGA